MNSFDANDWLYQTWAYERHDLGTTTGMEGDTKKALDSIKSKTLILLGTKDLLNPEWEPREAAGSIRDAKVVTIRPESVTGHAAAGGANAADVEFINREAAAFLEQVTEGGKRLN
jgi:homoserine O-acetyltransferase